MQQEYNYADTYHASAMGCTSHFHSLNIGDQEAAAEPFEVAHIEQHETSYHNCTWRDMIFALN